MVPLLDLWLPILLAAVFVFVASSVIHMALQYHKKDYLKLPGEEDALAALRAQDLRPGLYMFPRADSMKEMCSPEMVAKLNQGPVGYINVMPNGPPALGKSLTQWFVFTLLVGAFAGYVAGLGLPPGTDYMLVFRVTSVVALAGYGLGYAMDSIWKGVPWSSTAKYMLDGLVYALLTGGTFGWLWPAATSL